MREREATYMHAHGLLGFHTGFFFIGGEIDYMTFNLYGKGHIGNTLRFFFSTYVGL